MKVISTVLTLGVLVSLNGFASTSPVPASKLAAYQEAVVLAIGDGSSFECSVASGSISGGINTMVKGATSAVEDNGGAQPLLIFTSDDGTNQTVVSVTTSADYKSIVSLRAETLTKVTSDVNSGDLQNPSISQQTYMQSTGVGICNKK